MLTNRSSRTGPTGASSLNNPPAGNDFGSGLAEDYGFTPGGEQTNSSTLVLVRRMVT